MIGQVVAGKYAIVRLLGEGGMGSVYEARHTGTGRRVALKVITGDWARSPDSVERFQLEAKAAGALESEHIVEVLDVGHDPMLGAPFLAMEFLVGEDLQHILERVGALPPDLALRVGVQACLGLAKAHAQGVVHRDIKPANLFLVERESGLRTIKVLDFGIAKVMADGGGGPAPPKKSLTRTGAMLGSPLYMSPEQARGRADIDHRTDLWSLGVVLYEVLTGRTPLQDTDTLGDFIIAVCSAPPPPLRQVAPWVDPAIAAAVERALVIDPRMRYQSAQEMAAALSAFLPQDGGLIHASMLGPAGRDGAAPVVAAYGAPGISGSTVVAGAPYSGGYPTGTPHPSHASLPSMPGHPSMPSHPGQPIMGLPPLPNIAPPPPRPSSSSGSAGLLIAGGLLAVLLVVGGIAALAFGVMSKKSDPAASASAPEPDPRAAVAVTPEALRGTWKNEVGQVYDAVPSGDAVEFRIRQAEQFPGQSYAAGDARFVLRPSPDGGSYRLEDRIRPLPPRGTSYDAARARTTCLEARTAIDDKPLRGDVAGERLIVTLASLETSSEMFVRSGTKIVSCEGLAGAKATILQSVLTRFTPPEMSALAPQPGPAQPHPVNPNPVNPLVKPQEPPANPTPVQPPQPAPSSRPPEPPPAPAPAPAPAPEPDSPGKPGAGKPCSSDGECFTNNCTGGRCRGNKIGSACSKDSHCSTRFCGGGRCARR